MQFLEYATGCGHVPELRKGPKTVCPPPTNLGPHQESQGSVLWWITCRSDTWGRCCRYIDIVDTFIDIVDIFVDMVTPD